MKQEYKVGKLVAALVNGFSNEFRVCEIETVDAEHYGYGVYKSGDVVGLGKVYLDFHDCIVVPKGKFHRGQELTQAEFWALMDTRPGHIPPGELANYGARK